MSMLGRLNAVILLALALTIGVAVPAARAAEDPARLQRLAVDVERAEALRAVKRLQYAYAQFSEFGLWREMGDLFTADAELIYGRDRVRGRAAIANYFLSKFGGGKEGLPKGGVHVQMNITPVVTLAADGASAKGRWRELSMLGAYGGDANWAGGVMDNDYAKENGVWKISRLQFYAQFAGPYDKGWRNLEQDAAFIPYRFTPSDVGRPIPPAAANAKPSGRADLASLERRLDVMADEDAVRNLQNAYGYYVDRKMWDDVVDLFGSDGVLEIAGVGAYAGPKSVRRALERDGPADLQHGQLNDQLLLHTIVTVAPGGQEALTRGVQIGMLAENNKSSHWTETVFVNRFVNEGGTWRIKEMRLYPKMKTDYYQGWGKSFVVDPPPAKEFAPDRPARDAANIGGMAVIPAFTFVNPATGRAVRTPAGARVGKAAAPFARAATPASSADTDARIADAERRVRVAVGYDAAENLSSGVGSPGTELEFAL